MTILFLIMFLFGYFVGGRMEIMRWCRKIKKTEMKKYIMVYYPDGDPKNN